MTRRRLTRKRSALNPEPNMTNTFCGEEGLSLEPRTVSQHTRHCFTGGQAKKFPKQTILNLVIYK